MSSIAEGFKNKLDPDSLNINPDGQYSPFKDTSKNESGINFTVGYEFGK